MRTKNQPVLYNYKRISVIFFFFTRTNALFLDLEILVDVEVGKLRHLRTVGYPSNSCFWPSFLFPSVFLGGSPFLQCCHACWLVFTEWVVGYGVLLLALLFFLFFYGGDDVVALAWLVIQSIKCTALFADMGQQ